MKIAITGHTKGLGAGLYKHFQDHGHQVLGFSRTNGYPLQTKIPQIVENSLDCDVFINNAFAPKSYPTTSQVRLLNSLFDRWKNEKKTIINIGSYVTDFSIDVQHSSEDQDYFIEKTNLDITCKQLRKLNAQCKVILLRPNYIGSNRTLKMVNPEVYIDIFEICNLIDYIISSKIILEDVLFRKGKW